MTNGVAWHPVSYADAAQSGVGNQRQPDCVGKRGMNQKNWMLRQPVKQKVREFCKEERTGAAIQEAVIQGSATMVPCSKSAKWLLIFLTCSK